MANETDYIVIDGHRYELGNSSAWRLRRYLRRTRISRRREPTTIYVQPQAEPSVGSGLLITAGLVLVGGLAIWASTR